MDPNEVSMYIGGDGNEEKMGLVKVGLILENKRHLTFFA